jgi:hypothetical protein
MPKGIPGSGPRGRKELRKEPDRGDVLAEVREELGFRKTVDRVTSIRNRRASLSREDRSLSPNQEGKLRADEQRAEILAKRVRAEIQKRVRETFQAQGIARIGVINVAIDMLPDSIGVVYECLMSETAQWSDRLKAAQWIKETALARPQDMGGIQLASTDIREVSELTLEEMQATARDLQSLIDQKRAEAVSSPDPITAQREASPLDSADEPDSID